MNHGTFDYLLEYMTVSIYIYPISRRFNDPNYSCIAGFDRYPADFIYTQILNAFMRNPRNVAYLLENLKFV